ncbi:MAG: DUF397 domain-containing protein [Actinomycetota bacterium]|nr:DUF397 domain-containing protein [Actinomycetota bacterium]
MSQPIPQRYAGCGPRLGDGRKSRHSGQLGNCVQTAALPGGEVAMRNSHDPGGPTSIFSRDEMAAFLAGAKEGESDDYAG